MGLYYANLSIVQFRAMMLGVHVYVYIGYMVMDIKEVCFENVRWVYLSCDMQVGLLWGKHWNELSLIVVFFLLALRPNADHGLLIFEVSRSRTTTHHSR